MTNTSKYLKVFAVVTALCALLVTTAFASGPTGDVAGAVESTWNTASGQIKKSRVSDFMVQRNNRVMPAMSMKKGDELVKAFLVYNNDRILVLSKDGFANIYPADQVPTMGIKTRGVRAQNYGKGDGLASACALSEDDQTVLFTTTSGMMKRVKLEEIPENNRPAKGNLICKRIKSNPSILLNAEPIATGDELVFCDPEVQTIRAAEIPLCLT